MKKTHQIHGACGKYNTLHKQIAAVPTFGAAMVHVLIVDSVFCPVDVGSQAQLIHSCGVVRFYTQIRWLLPY